MEEVSDSVQSDDVAEVGIAELVVVGGTQVVVSVHPQSGSICGAGAAKTATVQASTDMMEMRVARNCMVKRMNDGIKTKSVVISGLGNEKR